MLAPAKPRFLGDEKGQLVPAGGVVACDGEAEYRRLAWFEKLARRLHCHTQVTGPVHF